MYRSRRQPINHGIPALVCIPTGETVVISGKRYKLLKLMYDLKGEYLPMATPIR